MSTALKPQFTREQLYDKWRGIGSGSAGKATTTDKKQTKKNTSLTPAHDVEDPAIAPPNGVETITVAPPGGAIDPVFTPLSKPSNGNHLEIPSTANSEVSADPGKGNNDDGKTEQVEVVRVRESEIEASLYDPATGEYFKPAPKPELRQKQAADAWVKSA